MVGLLKPPVLALVAVLVLFSSSTSALSCFQPGECIRSNLIGGDVVASKEECLQLCKYFLSPTFKMMFYFFWNQMKPLMSTLKLMIVGISFRFKQENQMVLTKWRRGQIFFPFG